jgi:hypothetical protein
MITLVFEAYGALCLFCLVVFLAWAAVAKSRPDLDEEELGLAELEKHKTLVRREGDSESPSIEPLIIEEPSWSPPAQWTKQRTRRMRRRTIVFHTRHPRTT